jgi:hypothetical protein
MKTSHKSCKEMEEIESEGLRQMGIWREWETEGETRKGGRDLRKRIFCHPIYFSCALHISIFILLQFK